MSENGDLSVFEEQTNKQSNDNGLLNMINEMDKKITAEASVGDKVKGKIISIGSEHAFLDIGLKNEAMISKSEIINEEGENLLTVGSELEAFVITANDDETILSKKLNKSKADIQAFIDAMEKKVPVEGRITGINKGGFNVKVMGKQSFCPFSQIDNKFVGEPADYLSKSFDFIISRVEKRGRNIVLTRLPLLEEEVISKISELKSKIDSKDIVSGTISKISSFGLFIDLGIVEGLVHISEVSWDRSENLEDYYSIGQNIDCVILKIEEKKPLKESRISLSIKQMGENPWNSVENKFKAGDTLEGTITRLAKFGAFIQLIPGIEGLIHNSEMAWDRKVRHASEIVKEGEKVKVTILEVNSEKKSISCTLKDADADPFSNIEKKFPLGSNVEGTVASETKYGFFIDLNEDLTGLLVHQNISKDKKGSIKKNDKIKVNINSIDKDNRRISLSYGNVHPAESTDSDTKKFFDNQKKESIDKSEFGIMLKAALEKKKGNIK